MYLSINNVIGILGQTRSGFQGLDTGERLGIVLGNEQDVKGRYSLNQFVDAFEAIGISLSAGEYTALSGVASHFARS